MAIWYTKTHQWFNEQTGEVGLTPFAAEQLGEISFVDVEALEGSTVEQVKVDGNEPTSDPLDCTVESSKAVGDIYSPVSGAVTAVNSDLMDEPEKINEDPFSAWLFKVDASNFEAEKANLLDEAAYKKHVASL
ncbi:MAG: glycine cleavage system protein H [Candidatus Lokiarchaeota archaeon]|nr:glycine cleavage system protein H [Candidatus Lokiarchaeota archaeon]